MRYRSFTSQRVIVKTASDWPLKNERSILEAVRDHPCIRPIIDASDDQPSLILKYLDDNLLNASNVKKLERADIKYVARNLLQALEALHSRGYVHTGILQKPFKQVVTPLLTNRQTLSLTTSLSTMAVRWTASAKSSSATVETLSRSTQKRAHLRRVMSSEQQYFAAPRQC